MGFGKIASGQNERIGRMVDIKNGLKKLLLSLFVIVLVSSLVIPYLVYRFKPYKVSELEFVSVTVVDRDNVRSGKKANYVYYSCNNGKDYYFPDRFRKQLETGLIGRTVNIWVGESRSSFDEPIVVAWEASGSDVRAGTVEETNKELKKTFLVILAVYISFCIFGLLYPIECVVKPIYKKIQNQKRKKTRQKRNLEIKLKNSEKVKKINEDPIRWNHTQKNTSKKKRKHRNKKQ